MKKALVLLFVGSMITFAACQSKPKTEETTTESMEVMSSDSIMSTDSSTAAPADSAAATADTTNN